MMVPLLSVTWLVAVASLDSIRLSAVLLLVYTMKRAYVTSRLQ